MKRLTKIAALAALAWPAMAAAQTPSGLVPCQDHFAGGLAALSLGENNANVRHFYNGMVTLLLLDTEEPAAASYGFAVLMPSGDGEEEPAFMTCWLNWGFTYVDTAAATSRYDPAEGLTLTIPVLMYDHETGMGREAPPVRLLINAGQGTIRQLD